MNKKFKKIKKYTLFQKLILILGLISLLLLLGVTFYYFFQKTQLISKATSVNEKVVNLGKKAFTGLESAPVECGEGNFALVKSRGKNGKKICTVGPEKLNHLLIKANINTPLSSTSPKKSQSQNTQVTDGFGARFFCFGDGKNGNRVQVLYTTTNINDDFSTIKNKIKIWAAYQTYVYYWSATETGEARYIKYYHDSKCEPIIDYVVLSEDTIGNFDNMIYELQEKGYNREDRKYMIYSNIEIDPDNYYCGIGTHNYSDSPDLSNPNNFGPSWGETDRDCWYTSDMSWFYTTPSHELMHNLGAVQNSAPHSTKGGHCTDEWDLMCYSDSPYYPPMNTRCPNSSDGTTLDCNHDDYYSTKVNIGDYLFTHWNTANSSFLMNNPTKHTDLASPLRIKIKTSDTNKTFPQQLTVRQTASSDCSVCNQQCTNIICSEREKTYQPSKGYAQWDYYDPNVQYSFTITDLPENWKISKNGCGGSSFWQPENHGSECIIEVKSIKKINGFVWHDDDNDPNGVKNQSENLTQGIVVYLYKNNPKGKPILLSQTSSNKNNNSNYSFNQLLSGTYSLRLDQNSISNQGLKLNTCNKVTTPAKPISEKNYYLYCMKAGSLVLKKYDLNTNKYTEVSSGTITLNDDYSSVKVNFPLVSQN